ncbi:MAG TPA: vanadium-dependent haloperoxidase [Vicinamibacterales bacterium]|nr:vanadium-dependent haloperoxidase [Vicinamibacterales bacterium]
MSKGTNNSFIAIRRVAAYCRVLAVATAIFTAPGIAAADAVTDWNAVAEAVAPRFGGPQQQSRVQAMVQIAVHDALNSIEPRYVRYTDASSGWPDAFPDAAVAAAARHTLLTLLIPLPDSALKQAAIDTIESAYLASVGPGPYDQATQLGIEAGEAAAEAILALRSGDGSDTPHLPYTLQPGPGVYQPTPNPEFPAAITPSFAGWAHVTPFVLRHGAQFEVEPGAIFDLTGAAYAREYNEVKSVGDARVRGARPDSEESDIARFWPGGGSNWNLTARVIVDGLGLDRWEHARLFALLNIAQADALIANQTWKYTYNFWRPVTAIRWPNDGNADTESDPVWRPFLVTPPYPDYPCALPTATGAAAEVLRQFFGTDAVAFSRTFNAPAVPLPAPMTALPAKLITRSFSSLSEAADEARDARVYAGIHFREGCDAGLRQGTQIGRFVVRQSLRPARN